MPPIIVTTDAGRPAAEVFTYATDPARCGHQARGYVFKQKIMPY